MDLTPAQTFSKKPLIITVIILILVIIYAVFWLNFFGVYKPSFIPKSLSPQVKQQEKIDSLIKNVKTVDRPLDPDIKQDAHRIAVGTIEDLLTQAKEALAKGEIEKARDLVKSAESQIYIMGATRESQPLSDELKRQHDPKNKYIKRDSIDPRVKDIYLQIIDLLVAADPSY